MGDITTPESAADDHAESVGVDALDIGGGFNDAASDDAGLPPGQLGGGEGVGEDVVVQTRDTTEPINRDGTEFVGNVSPGRVPHRSGHLLSLSGLTPAGTGRAEHFGDGVGGHGGKAVSDGAKGKLLTSLPDFLHPNHIVFLCHNADVGVLVEDLFDGDEVLIIIVMTERVQDVNRVRWVTAKTIHTRSSRRKGQGDPGPYPRDGPRSLWRPWQFRCS